MMLPSTQMHLLNLAAASRDQHRALQKQLLNTRQHRRTIQSERSTSTLVRASAGPPSPGSDIPYVSTGHRLADA
eukprot:3596442-Rhodomonas_salina.2